MKSAPGALRFAAFVESHQSLRMRIAIIVHALATDGGEEPVLNLLLNLCRIGPLGK